MKNSNVGKLKILYGKYKGETYDNIIKKDPGYMKWFYSINKNDEVNEYIKTNIKN